MLNRARVLEAVRAAGEASRRESLPSAVLMLRVRRTREVAVLFGYQVAEALVDAVEARIGGALRADDRCWRTGDAAFVLSLPRLRDASHAALAAAKLVRVLQQPLAAAGRTLVPVVSVGIAVGPQHGEDPEALCRLADEACEVANDRVDRFAFHEPRGPQVAFSDEELREAIAGNQLTPCFQPILDLATGRLDRCEALARWTHPRLGPVPPEVFVRVAEQTGQIAELTRWSLNTTLRSIAQAGARAGGAPIASVNVAVDALQQPGFVDQVLDQLGFWSVPASHLVLEITESGLMRNPEHCERLLRALRDAGVGVAIDDFGTGYSSMAYLRRLPANELKIDKSFVRDMRSDARARKLVESMVDVSHHLGMTTVAEGVEDPDTLELLRAMGCDHAQGYAIGRPAPADEALPKLAGRARA